MGCPGHSWFMTAQTNSSIGRKGLLRAAEILALAAVKAMHRPETLAAARAEMIEYTGGTYNCPMDGAEIGIYME